VESNKKEALNLYAKVEDLLGIKEYAPKLYSYYYEILDTLEFNSLLDIGCGSGDFLLKLQKRYENSRFLGIDKSSQMVKVARDCGVDALNIEIEQLNIEFDIATATFDMVNYLTPQEFIDFFNKLKSVIKKDGYFIFDVNTEFGLSDLAVGNFIAQDSNRFITIESFYENGLYESNFTLFERVENCYNKSQERIFQYSYSRDFFKLLSGWEIDRVLPIKLYEMEKFDKEIYILKNVD